MTKIVLDFPEYQDVRDALAQCWGWIQADFDRHRSNPYYPGVLSGARAGLDVLQNAYVRAIEAQVEEQEAEASL